MAPPGVGDIVRIAARHRFDSLSDQVNVFHVQITTVTGGSGNEFLQDVQEWLIGGYSLIQGSISNLVDPADITAYNITDDAPLGQIDWGTWTGGSGSGEALPPGTCGLVLWRTNVKRTLGKTFLPTFVEGTQANGILTAGTGSDMDDFAQYMMAPFSGTNSTEWWMGVYKRSTGQLHAPTSGSASPVIAYQRRRRPGTGS